MKINELLNESEQKNGWVLQHTAQISDAANKTTIHKIGGKVVEFPSKDAAQKRADVLNNQGKSGRYTVAHIKLSGPTIKR